MEDLLAHSNWCELALRRLGHEEVFCHVGDNGMYLVIACVVYLIVGTVIVNTPNGPAPPLITGTFGSADFIHSLMGEATEYALQLLLYFSRNSFHVTQYFASHLSEASVTDLYAKMDDVRMKCHTPTLRSLTWLPGRKLGLFPRWIAAYLQEIASWRQWRRRCTTSRRHQEQGL